MAKRLIVIEFLRSRDSEIREAGTRLETLSAFNRPQILVMENETGTRLGRGWDETGTRLGRDWDEAGTLSAFS